MYRTDNSTVRTEMTMSSQWTRCQSVGLGRKVVLAVSHDWTWNLVEEMVLFKCNVTQEKEGETVGEDQVCNEQAKRKQCKTASMSRT